MKVLVLGATGSIGTAVTKELIAHDHSLIALSRSTASTLNCAAGAPPRFEAICESLNNG